MLRKFQAMVPVIYWADTVGAHLIEYAQLSESERQGLPNAQLSAGLN